MTDAQLRLLHSTHQTHYYIHKQALETILNIYPIITMRVCYHVYTNSNKYNNLHKVVSESTLRKTMRRRTIRLNFIFSFFKEVQCCTWLTYSRYVWVDVLIYLCSIKTKMKTTSLIIIIIIIVIILLIIILWVSEAVVVWQQVIKAQLCFMPSLYVHWLVLIIDLMTKCCTNTRKQVYSSDWIHKCYSKLTPPNFMGAIPAVHMRRVRARVTTPVLLTSTTIINRQRTALTMIEAER